MFSESKAGRQLMTGAPREGLAAFIDFYLSTTHRDARTFGCPLPVLSSEASRLPSASGRLFASGAAKLTDMLAAKLRELDTPDADTEAAALLAQLIGAVALARAETNRDASDLILERSRRTISRRFELDLSSSPKTETRN
jgi:TetR/AcrR family transcriptional repressor of nem operon